MSSRCLRALTLAVLSGLVCLDGSAGSPATLDTERVPSAPPRPQVLAPGYANLRFAPPEPGAYRLPVISRAADGGLLDTEGEPVRLHDIYDGRYVILSFIYSSCSDVNGCPLATYVLYRLFQRIARDPALAEQVRLLTLSFDPVHDTPEVMRLYGAGFIGQGAEWVFLTAESEAALDPILASYGQSVTRMPGGGSGEVISHVLRVFLIDREKRVRNIYSTSFLHPDLVLADLQTLVLEAREGTAPRPQDPAVESPRTRELLMQTRHPPLGLPPLPAPPQTSGNTGLTAAKIDLGRRLFFDRRLSANGTLSCAMCHIPTQGYTNHAMSRAVGIGGRSLRRNASSLYNVGHVDPLFPDGRERFLESLTWQELLDLNRMGNRSVAMVLDEIQSASDYRGLFEAAFDGRPAGLETLGEAMATYLRTLVSGQSPFDRWYYGGELGALDASAERGFELFTGRAGCADCHRLGDDHALFTDQRLHNTGIGWAHSMQPQPRRRTLEIVPGVRIEVDLQAVAGTEERPYNDLGHYEVTQDPVDRWRFRTPSLRNVSVTAPYMHDGSLTDLDAVVAYYDRGGHPHPELDERIRPLGLSAQDRADLVAFLHALEGDNLALIEADAAVAPIGMPAGRRSD
ncbi:cytochrome c peroxidase [Thiocapsa rosea]|uniref:Methylamine utilization protein MauG n=1 Tax=Thiocapsa rosea TaxID=69360 RepID=A0A495VES8_9GAMM|nr:cytochrome c peroxidase [Thiocapsa rosea]RKT47103.1 cytochrome c peroxidase [Thiocapsa rosea]